jgi:hypothetical protein
VTKRGDELLRAGDEVFDGLRREWEKQVGIGAISDLERALRELVGTRTIRFDATNGSSGDPDAT